MQALQSVLFKPLAYFILLVRNTETLRLSLLTSAEFEAHEAEEQLIISE